MYMSTKSIVLGILAVLVVTIVFSLRFSKDSYKLLPMDTTHPESAGLYGDWYEYSSPDGNFKVQLPLLPQEASQNLTDPTSGVTRNYAMYVAQEANGTIFMISLITFPEGSKAFSQDQLLKDLMEDMVAANPKNKLSDVKPGMYKDFPSMDFTITNDQTKIFAKEFVKDHTIYVLSVISKNDADRRVEFDHFVESFQLQATSSHKKG